MNKPITLAPAPANSPANTQHKPAIPTGLVGLTQSLAAHMPADRKEAIKDGIAIIIRHYPYVAAKTDEDTLRQKNIECAFILAEFEPQVVLLSVMEWLARKNPFAPNAGEWRDYCLQITDAIRHGARFSNHDYRLEGHRVDAKHERERVLPQLLWREHMLPATRAFIRERQEEPSP